jgi:selenocysteine lyase/cysteine desulfurase
MIDQFPVLEQPPYLNHAAVGPWPRCTAEAVQSFAEENLQKGSAGYLEWIRRERQLRERLAVLTGAGSPEDIALLKNTTEGISVVAFGLDWREGDNVVLPAGEFASNRLPWLAQSARGVEAREVDIRAAADAEQALVDALDSRTRVLTVSAVQWSDGFRLDLERLGKACHDRGVLFFVDAIQQLGALPLDAEACRIDALAADAHKWLLAPEGIAVFYCRKRVRGMLELGQQGWHMVEQPWNFDREDWTPAASALRFEAGSPNTVGQAALNASVGLLLATGMDAVGARVLANTDYLVDALGRRPGIRVTSRIEPQRRSGIVSFRHDEIPSSELYRGLQDSGVMCALRGQAVRLSPHFYQDESVLEDFLRILAHMV